MTRVGNYFLSKIPIESALLGRVGNFIFRKIPIESDILLGQYKAKKVKHIETLYAEHDFDTEYDALLDP